MFLKTILVSLLVPPFGFVTLALLGLLLSGSWRRLGRNLIGASLIGLTVLAMPVVSDMMLEALERDLPRIPPPSAPPGAIVVLGAEIRRTDDSPGVVVGRLSLERLRTAATLQRRTGLPVLISGGALRDDLPAIATVMATSLEGDFRIPSPWLETKSRDTWENARFSADILRARGITSVYVVTHAWHMRRALQAFRRTDLTATAAPIPPDMHSGWMAEDFLPHTSSWTLSYFALHEWIGTMWYAIR